MSLDEYVAAQQRNLEAIRESPHYSRLIETVDRMYRATIDLGPAHCPRICFGKMLLMCHKSLLSATTLIGRGQPEDSAPISRRAIEIGHLAIAVHMDSQNYLKWLDQERRVARNEARLRGERPKNDPGHKWSKEVLEHPALADLRTLLGMLSDHYAHFSPEFEGNLAWSEEITLGEGMTLSARIFRYDEAHNTLGVRESCDHPSEAAGRFQYLFQRWPGRRWWLATFESHSIGYRCRTGTGIQRTPAQHQLGSPLPDHGRRRNSGSSFRATSSVERLLSNEP
jgi:hypothetical protein